MSSYKKMSNAFKEMLGRELKKIRVQEKININQAAERARLPWYEILLVEASQHRHWGTYKQLLDCYGKDIQIVLTDKNT